MAELYKIILVSTLTGLTFADLYNKEEIRLKTIMLQVSTITSWLWITGAIT